MIHIFKFTDHKKLISKEIICAEHEYMNKCPLPIIEFSMPLAGRAFRATRGLKLASFSSTLFTFEPCG